MRLQTWMTEQSCQYYIPNIQLGIAQVLAQEDQLYHSGRICLDLAMGKDLRPFRPTFIEKDPLSAQIENV